MNPCEKYEDLCSAALDGMLTEAEQQQLQQHLAECPSCRAYMDELQAMCAMWKEVPLPETVHERIMQQIQKEATSTVVQMPHKQRRRPPVFTMLAAAAACVMLAVSGQLTGLFGQLNATPITPSTAQVDPPSGAQPRTSSAITPSNATDTTQQAIPDQQTLDEPDAQEQDLEQQDVEQPQSNDLPQSRQSEITEDDPQQTAIDQPDVDKEPAPAEQDEQVEQDPQVDSSQQTMVGSPRVMMATAPSIPQALQSMTFARCFLLTGQGELPVIEGMTLLVNEDGIAYYSVENNESKIEKVRQALEKAGYQLTLDESSGITIQRDASEIVIVYQS